MNRRIVALTAAAILAAIVAPLRPAAAETVEVAPGIEVTRKAFKAPASEAPFFGLVDKEPTLRKTFAQEYAAYCARVPRWIPRLKAEGAKAQS